MQKRFTGFWILLKRSFILQDSNIILGVGIRGTGQVALQHIIAIQKNPNAQVVAICGRDLDKVKTIIKNFNLRAKGYVNYEDMLLDVNVDIVSECMPNYLHADEAILAFKAGKHLILEKPAGINREQTDKILQASKESGKLGVCSLVLRWHPLVCNIKKLLKQNAFGDVYFVQTDYWHGIKKDFSSYSWIRKKEFAGGAMITGGCHAVDISRYLNGEITEVFAYKNKNRDDFDYDTTYNATVKFENGSLGRISATLDGVAFPYQFNIDLLGKEGAIRGNKFYSNKLIENQNDWCVLPCETPDSGSVNHHPFSDEINNLINGILNEEEIICPIEDACKSMNAVYAIMESADTGKPVFVR